MLPKDFPPSKNVYDHFRRWNLQGIWERVLDDLNRQRRVQLKKRCSQLRHHRLSKVLECVVDTFTSIRAFSDDAGYRGTTVEFVEQQLGLAYHISTKIKDGFAVFPTRWVVERTFAWLGNFRRLFKDIEILTGTAENIIRVAMLKIILAELR